MRLFHDLELRTAVSEPIRDAVNRRMTNVTYSEADMITLKSDKINEYKTSLPHRTGNSRKRVYKMHFTI